MNRCLCLAAALLLAVPAISSGAASLPEITTIGAGGDVCSKWIAAIKEPGARYQYRQWLFGFMSGYNWRDPSKQVVPPDSNAPIAWVDEFCKINPAVPVYMAAARMARQMEKPQNVVPKKP
jgi:hypothetical protein